MIQQSFNYADTTVKETTDLFKTKVEKLETKEEQRNFSVAAKKSKDKKSLKKRKKVDANFTVINSSA